MQMRVHRRAFRDGHENEGRIEEADMNALAVIPRTSPDDSAVMTVTPDANRPMTRRNSDESIGGACSDVATRFTSTLPFAGDS
jgi:hypothetical protein